ncbi:MAG: helicase-exonuclease AddAB subunit AddB [Bacillales bacterium]|jgi:ATP-dependent helicase/nuclease subunit B|nr:helicase-exonuclease AddAB subunit AddB [Bacillales bacterium]
MSLRFILGRSGSGKSNYILEDIKTKLKENPLGDPIILLVPDQMTFQTSYELISSDDVKGTVRAQVLSLKRLAWWLLQETGGLTRTHINKVGVWMLLRKIIEDNKDSFNVYRRAAEQTGFIEQVEQVIREFKRYELSPSSLADIENKIKLSDISLQQKLGDIKLIYDQFEKEIAEKYLDGQDYLDLLAEKIPQANYLKNAEIYIDGFHDLTPQELKVISALLANVKRVNITLTVELPQNGILQPMDLFYMTWETSIQLVNLAKENKIKIESPLFLSTENGRFTNAKSLAHLEKNYDIRPIVTYNEVPEIEIFSAGSRRAEVEAIAREIIHTVRRDNLRYNEIAVLVRNADEYNSLIKTVFFDFNIPMYIDEKRKMKHHPLIELIRASLDIFKSNWRYEAVFRCLKTDLLITSNEDAKHLREKIDFLENYCLANGIKGSKWTSNSRWKYGRFLNSFDNRSVQTTKEKEVEDELNHLKNIIATPLISFFDRFKAAESIKDKCYVIVEFLEECNIPEKLDKWRIESEGTGDLNSAIEHQQAWKAVMELFEQMVEVVGNDTITTEGFIKIIESGIEGLEFSFVPSALDQVLIANFDHSRFSKIKTAFVLGMNEGVFPRQVKDEGVLKTEDRELLESNGIKLGFSSRQKILNDHTAIYLALTLPSEKLYLTVPLADEEGSALIPSMYIRQIKEMYPLIKDRFVSHDPMDIKEDGQEHFIINARGTLSYLIRVLQRCKKGESGFEIWKAVYNSYAINRFKDVNLDVLDGLFYKNNYLNLPIELNEKLYGKTIEASVSRIENFFTCPFKHFSNYGLQLREREEYTLQRHQVGSLYHECIRLMFVKLRNEGKSWSDLTANDARGLAGACLEILTPKFYNEILMSSNKYKYVTKRLEKVLMKVAEVIREHSLRSEFKPYAMEEPFGAGKRIPEISLSLEHNFDMSLRGRIDRIDIAQVNDKKYLRILDYKSSNKKLDLNEVYYGLALQLVTYLDLVVDNSKSWLGESAEAAGVLYFPMINPVLSMKNEADEAKIKDDIFKKFKMRGLLLSNEEVLKLMDIETKEKGSPVVNIYYKKDGLSDSESYDTIDEGSLMNLRKFTRNQFVTAGNKIVCGDVTAYPSRYKSNMACSYCEYKFVCQFDRQMEANKVNNLRAHKKNDLIEMINKEVGEEC